MVNLGVFLQCITNVLLFAGYIRDGLFCHFVASMISGLITTAASMPVDIAKTRIQNMKIIDGKPEYKGAVVSLLVFESYALTNDWSY